ncbi:MAG: hypothetical protein IKT72_04950, partial [Clostridia bacterium]|nr:hypothetical protein [Clostridia bacterium]
LWGASDLGEKRRLRPEGVYTYSEREQTAVEKIQDKKEEIRRISTLKASQSESFHYVKFLFG